MTDQSWGYFPRVAEQKSLTIPSRLSELPRSTTGSLLPRGWGRSYGDSCLNDHGNLLLTKALDNFIDFDAESGVVTAESGVTLARLLEVFVPRGWFLPVTPGTKFITLGGAVANDVHGKNHHVAGNFGRFVDAFELLRSDGQRLVCSRQENSELFAATIGGLGLTGMITWVRFRLRKIQSAWIQQEQIKFSSVDEFLRLSQESKNYEYTVSWCDCLGHSDQLRGIFIRGDHLTREVENNFQIHRQKNKLSIPTFFPDFALNPVSIKTFNELYYHKNLRKETVGIVHYDPFFYPLDAIHQWNRIYGKSGFLQYQFVIPFTNDNEVGLRTILKEIKSSHLGSFLAVLKTFGDISNEGLMSFPKEGITLALDFPVRGPKLFEMLNRCDNIVAEMGGAVYPAKDSRMNKNQFRTFFPRLEEFRKYVDPHFSSTFWRRMNE